MELVREHNTNIIYKFTVDAHAAARSKKRVCTLDHTAEGKHSEEMFARTLYYHQLNSSSRLQTITYRKFCRHSQIYSEK